MFKTELALLPGVPHIHDLIGESISTVKDVIKRIGDPPEACTITKVVIVSKSSSAAVITAYAGDRNIFQFDMFHGPCSRGPGGIRNGWIRYRYSVRDLVHFYSQSINSYLAE